MKAILKAYNIILLIAVVTLSNNAIAGEDPLVEKKKTYNKSYSVSGSEKISIDNQFGELKINAWDKNEVKVDVTITAKAATDERAQKILDLINIEDGKGSSGVWFKTKMKDDNKHNDKNHEKDKEEKGKYRDEGFTINYVVYLPSGNPLDAENQFGPMSIGDHSGEVELFSQFGSLTAGKLSNVNKVKVAFGTATIESIRNGNVDIQFSRAVINKLEGSVDAKFEHCGGIKINADNNLKALDLKMNFSTLYLDASKNLSANFDINTNHGSFSNKSNFEIKEEKENDSRHGPQFNYHYQGKAGGGSTSIYIKASFGQIVVGHDLTMDLKEDKKDKETKKKTRSI